MHLRLCICYLLSRIKIHNPDCEHCNAHKICWGEMKKRLEELNWAVHEPIGDCPQPPLSLK